MPKECVTHHFACDCRERKFRKLYEATNVLMGHIGAYGDVSSRDKCVEDVMHVLFDIDGGEYNPTKVFGGKQDAKM